MGPRARQCGWQWGSRETSQGMYTGTYAVSHSHRDLTNQADGFTRKSRLRRGPCLTAATTRQGLRPRSNPELSLLASTFPYSIPQDQENAHPTNASMGLRTVSISSPREHPVFSSSTFPSGMPLSCPPGPYVERGAGKSYPCPPSKHVVLVS